MLGLSPQSLTTSKDRILLINYLHLKFRRVNCLSISRPLKQLSSAILKNICSGNFLQIITKAPLVEFIFSIILCSQYILLITYYLLRKLFFDRCLILDIQITFSLQKLHCKSFQWKFIKNKNRHSNLGKKTKTNISSCFSIGRAPWFYAFFFACPIEHPSKIH